MFEDGLRDRDLTLVRDLGCHSGLQNNLPYLTIWHSCAKPPQAPTGKASQPRRMVVLPVYLPPLRPRELDQRPDVVIVGHPQHFNISLPQFTDGLEAATAPAERWAAKPLNEQIRHQ